MKQHQFHVERIIEADEQLAVEVGALLTDLSDKLSGDPVDMALLSSIVDSPDRDLFIARLDGRLVGSAVMNLITFTSGKKAWLEDFVVSSEESVRGTGIGYALWQEILAWSQSRKAPLEFTSSPVREHAHSFYHRQGATIKPTAVFYYDK
jgi:GNAT superfamily N-acetyltransferase